MAPEREAKEGPPEAAALSAPGLTDWLAGLRQMAWLMGAAWCPSGSGGRFLIPSRSTAAAPEARRGGDGARSVPRP